MSKVVYSDAAAKTLSRMDRTTSNRIISKVSQLARDPSSLANNVKRMQGEVNMWRLRVGNWRVIYDDNGTVLFVFKVGPRGSVYD